MRITIRDIARNLDLSHSTVSKVLNRRLDSFISDTTRERVEKEAKKLGYRPNHAARALATGKTGLIGLGIGDFFHSYNTSVMHHVDNHLQNRGYQMLVQRFREPECAAKLLDWPLDGLITLDYPNHVKALVEASPKLLPIVSMGTYSAEITDHVELDLFVGAQQAMRHLVAQGYTRILYVVSAWGNRVGEPRRDAYFEGMNRAGLEPEYLLTASPTREMAYSTLLEFLADRPFGKRIEKTALFCFSDEIAIGCYRALMENGLRVPEDVGLVGCDDSINVQYLECPLSSVSYSIGQLCDTALDFLEARIENPALGRQKAIVTSHFVSRKSTADG